MNKVLLVALGGAIGSVLRYWAGGYVQKLSGTLAFPYGTLAVNLIGCVMIGALAYLAEARGAFTEEARALLFVGLLGGFTTFSSFGNETLALFRDGRPLTAFGNVGLHMIAGLGAVWAGRALGALVWK